MSIARSRTAHAIVDAPRGRTMGWWGMYLMLIAFTTGLAGLVAAGLYLHTGQEAWPPEELTRPGRGLALIAIVLAVVTAVVTRRAVTRLRSGHARSAGAALAGAVVTSLATVLVLARDLAGSGFRWDAHAYTSLYWVTTGTSAVLVAVGTMMLVAVLIQQLTGVVDPDRMLELEMTGVYSWWLIPAITACLAVAHLLPDPARSGLAAVATLVGAA